MNPTQIPGPEPGDAFGAMVIATQTCDARTVCGFLERDDGSLLAIPAARYLELEPIDKHALDLAIGDILDLGSGPGRHAAELTGRGHTVTALDTSAGCVELCQRIPGVTAVQGRAEDITAMKGQEFDTILLMGNNIGLAGKTSNVPAFLRSLSGMLRPGGRILATSVIAPLSSSNYDEDYVARNLRLGRAAGDVLIRFRFARFATDWHYFALLPPDVLVASIEREGFRVAGIHKYGTHYLLVADMLPERDLGLLAEEGAGLQPPVGFQNGK